MRRRLRHFHHTLCFLSALCLFSSGVSPILSFFSESHCAAQQDPGTHQHKHWQESHTAAPNSETSWHKIHVSCFNGSTRRSSVLWDAGTVPVFYLVILAQVWSTWFAQRPEPPPLLSAGWWLSPPEEKHKGQVPALAQHSYSKSSQDQKYVQISAPLIQPGLFSPAFSVPTYSHISAMNTVCCAVCKQRQGSCSTIKQMTGSSSEVRRQQNIVFLLFHCRWRYPHKTPCRWF